MANEKKGKKWYDAESISSIKHTPNLILYDLYLKQIEKGFIDFKIEATRLCNGEGFSFKKLEDALDKGIPKYYNSLLEYIRKGYMDYAEEAIEISEKYAFDQYELENILNEGELANVLHNIKFGRNLEDNIYDGRMGLEEGIIGQGDLHLAILQGKRYLEKNKLENILYHISRGEKFESIPDCKKGVERGIIDQEDLHLAIGRGKGYFEQN